ncbi:hypothetical protein C8J57DRAFT_1223310 [Mycena rebaudengoi]|nr:hypothetical protein C8J57DRAFT_1223310 [Mycena rebaudengoi]
MQLQDSVHIRCALRLALGVMVESSVHLWSRILTHDRTDIPSLQHAFGLSQRQLLHVMVQTRTPASLEHFNRLIALLVVHSGTTWFLSPEPRTPSKNTSIGLSPLPPSSDRFCTPEESPSDHQEFRDLLYPKHTRAQEAGNWVLTLGLDEEVDAEKKTGET